MKGQERSINEQILLRIPMELHFKNTKKVFWFLVSF